MDEGRGRRRQQGRLRDCLHDGRLDVPPKGPQTHGDGAPRARSVDGEGEDEEEREAEGGGLWRASP